MNNDGGKGMKNEREFEVIEISPYAKYVIVANVKLSLDECERIASKLDRWQDSNNKFLLLSGEFMLKRIDE